MLTEAGTGFDPNDPATDNGANMLSVLKQWRKDGIAGHKIGAYAAYSAARAKRVRQAIWLFGSTYLGLALPAAAQELKIWDIPEGQPLTGDWYPGSWGGHAVEAPKYDQSGVSVVTWGELLPVTYRFLAAYCDEAFAVLSQELFLDSGKCPAGFDADALQQDLRGL